MWDNIHIDDADRESLVVSTFVSMKWLGDKRQHYLNNKGATNDNMNTRYDLCPPWSRTAATMFD